MLMGRAGRAGGCSSARGSLAAPLTPSLSNLLAAAEWCRGGASNGSLPTWTVLDRCSPSCCALGRVGSAGGASWSRMPLLLLGGLPKGETFSLARFRTSGVGWVGCENRVKRAAPISGFSARFTGGGTGLAPSLVSRSRLNSPDRLGSSPDRRGGGGEGGCEGDRRGDLLRGSSTGVRGRLGDLTGFVGAAGEVGLMSESVFTKAGRSPVGRPTPRLGGECGGSTVRAGAGVGRGLMGDGRGRVGDVERPLAAAKWGMVDTLSLSLERVGGAGGGSRAAEGLGSRSRRRPGFGAGTGAGGAGDAVRDEGPELEGGWRSALLRFSNLASSEETGRWHMRVDTVSVLRLGVVGGGGGRAGEGAGGSAHDGRAVRALLWRTLHGGSVRRRAWCSC